MSMNSAGGGGKSEYRNQKIEWKNDKLQEERRKAVQHEEKVKDRKAKKQGGDSAQVDGAADAQRAPASGDHTDIHPSRRAQMMRT